MSNKTGGGGSVSGRRGGGASSKMSVGYGGATTPQSGGRDSHFKVLETDSKYGMLMWQSKLQEKLLKEQKEKKQSDLASAMRRKSDEDYQAQAKASRTGPLRGGGSGGGGASGSYNTFRPSKDNGMVPDPRVNFSSESPNEFRIEISREEDTPTSRGAKGTRRTNNPLTTTTPTHFISARSPQSQDPSEKFVSADSVNEFTSNFAQSNFYEDIHHTQTGGGAQSDFVKSNEHMNNSDGGNKYNPRGNNTDAQYEWVVPTDSADDNQVRQGQGGGGTRYHAETYHHQNQYRRDLVPDLDKNNGTMLPKIEKVFTRGRPSGGQMPKLSNSISYDSLTKPNHHHQGQTTPAAGITSTPYNFSSNLAFFGLMGFGGGTGAGAPRRSPSGRLMTNLQGHPEIRYHQKDTRGFDQTLRYMMDKERISQYKEDLDKQVLENARQKVRVGSIPMIKIMSSHESNQNLATNETDDDLRRFSRGSNNGVELAPLIRKYKSLPKLNALSSTDVTKQFSSPRRGDQNCLSPEPEEIAKGLSIQLAEKQKMYQITQENERLAAEKHFNTWDSFWGRPGCGAPMVHYRNSRIGQSTPSLASSRTDLFKALHMTHQNKPKEK